MALGPPEAPLVRWSGRQWTMDSEAESSDVVSDAVEKVSGGGGESNGETSAKRPRVDVSSLPTRQYLDQTVVPILLQAVTQLNKERHRMGVS
ncbi:dosage compensation protein dpy-30-like isoform X4 [Homarus americanus]|uniref:dosage compensation protein dpy-30-like isoform X4 n=1 Tax=Homarus americanus TaxID=6706 RepID=UPI001C43DBB2|nr:dosage compensation protein dpy-30-like isoform X4 [Homarus americanus]